MSNYTVVSRSKIKEIKGSFKTFFQGIGDYVPHVNETYIHVSTFEITNLEFAFKPINDSPKRDIILTVTLGCPGLLIGRSGKTIKALEKYLSDDEYNVFIHIKESDIWD